MSLAEWNQGLLLSVVLVVVGGMLLVGASSLRERLIAIGMLTQAIVLAFVTNGTFHGRGDLPLAAIVLASLFVLWGLLAANSKSDTEATHEIGLTAGVLSPSEATPVFSDAPMGDRSRPVEER